MLIRTLLGISILAASLTAGPASKPSEPNPAAKARAREAYGSLPLYFEANAGQADRHLL